MFELSIRSKEVPGSEKFGSAIAVTASVALLHTHTHTTDSQKLSRRWGLSIGIFVTCAQTVARAGINDRLRTPSIAAAAAAAAAVAAVAAVAAAAAAAAAAVAVAAEAADEGEICWVFQAVSLLYIRL